MAFELPSLPYAKDALAPHISAETFDFHHGKHHQGYINKLNAAIAGTKFADKSLDEIIKKSDGKIFNCAAQHFNHSFFWKCLKPGGGGAPTGALAAAIDRDFGSFDAFKEQFLAAATGQFGSGWAWLVQKKNGTLKITSTSDAKTPASKKKTTPLFTCDVWEHAYYIDFRNNRGGFVKAVLNDLADWDFAASNFKA